MSKSSSLQTRLLHAGKSPAYSGGIAVNQPVVRASTVLFANTAEQREMRSRRGSERIFSYGARGTPTTFALEDVLSEMEGAWRTRLFPTGLAAIGMTLLAYLEPGDHFLMADSVYEPARALAQGFLKRHGISCTFFEANGLDLQAKWQDNTKLVYVECPGSLVYEMCDLRAISAYAHTRGALVVADNTWGSGVQYQPLQLGADISLLAATKYLSGHSDVMMGAVSTKQACWSTLNECCDAFGMTVSPDDAWLVMRGVRSMTARLQMHERHALQIANWLQARPEVPTVFCPALPEHPGHELWKRDCSGTNGLISFELIPGTEDAAVDRLIDGLKLFGIGASWGGYESLVTIAHMNKARTVSDWSKRGPVVRLHIGLEDPADLIADLESGFARIQA
ncbi:MAG: cystathionine beta-lyase [Comamonadaceae bacterium]|nr:cystathionine beta-lyase [Comamonadaceae bacterium]